MKPTTPVVLVVATLALLAAGGVAAGSTTSDAATATAGASTAATQDDLVTVQVEVTTPEGEPISGAEATFDWEGADDPPSRTTVSDGTFRTDVPASGEWTMELSHDDYVRNFEFSREGADADERVEVTMHPPAEPAVTVVDADGQPIEDAEVAFGKVTQDRTAFSGTTGSDGEFTPDPIEQGEYELSVVAQGYYENATTVEVDGNFSREVVLEEGTVQLDLHVQDPTPSGPGTLDAQVTFSRNDEQVKQVRTNDAGGRTVSLAVNTRYEVAAEREGYRTARKAITTGEEQSEYVINMTRVPGISLEVGNRKVVVGENLQVEVTDEYDRPVEGATVSVDGEEVAETGSDGTARVQISGEGNVTVSAAAEGHETREVTVEGVPESQSDDTGGSGGSGDMTPGPGLVGALHARVLGLGALARRS